LYCDNTHVCCCIIVLLVFDLFIYGVVFVNKNDKHLISALQTVSYLLLLGRQNRNDKFFKAMSNDSIAFLKKEIKKLKRY